MPFELFTRERIPLDQQPYVTIQRRGTFSLNEAAFTALGEPEAVELLFDREERLVALRKADPALEHSYPVRGRRRRGPFLVSGTAFTAFYGIPTDVARRWPAELRDDALVLDLNEAGTEVSSNRARQRREKGSA